MTTDVTPIMHGCCANVMLMMFQCSTAAGKGCASITERPRQHSAGMCCSDQLRIQYDGHQANVYAMSTWPLKRIGLLDD